MQQSNKSHWIVSSQAVLQMSTKNMDTHSMSSLPLINSLIKNQLFKTAPDIDEQPFQFIHTMDLSVVDMMLHDSPDLVIHKTEIWAVWRRQVKRKESFWSFLTLQFNCCTCYLPVIYLLGHSKKMTVMTLQTTRPWRSRSKCLLHPGVLPWMSWSIWLLLHQREGGSIY